MELLIIGGTRFLGRALVDAARATGHRVTLFNRGRSNPDLFQNIETLTGDRDQDLDKLAGQRWDVVIDTCGYTPGQVLRSASALRESVDRYIFISSLSVYADFKQPGIDETYPVGKLEDESIEEVNGETYGPLKALCEQAAERVMPGRVLVIRPGLIVGPHDLTDRFAYWPHRIAQGGNVLAPGDPGQRISFIDVRDLAAWIVWMAKQKATGIYNADGPGIPLTMGGLLDTCIQVADEEANLVWVSEDFILEEGVTPWSELPLWIPASDPDTAGFSLVDTRKAIAAGLSFRPVSETIRDTLDWLNTRPADHAWRAGLDRAKEVRLLDSWQAREKGHPRP